MEWFALWRVIGYYLPETDADSKSAPALVDDALYYGSNDRSVYAVDANTGDELWSLETGRIVQSPPTVASERSTSAVTTDTYMHCQKNKGVI